MDNKYIFVEKGATIDNIRNIRKPKKNKGFVSEICSNKYLYAIALPGLIFFLIFSYLPIVGLIIAFQDFNPVKGIFASKFVGFRNFEFFFQSSNWPQVTFNTLYLNVLFISTGMLVSIIIALIVCEIRNVLFKKTVQSIVIFPNFISWTVVAMFAYALFASDSGLVNAIVKALGLKPISFYADASVWPLILVLLKIWQGAGFGSIIYIAAIAGIDQELYEAAYIDGATKIQGIWYITLPLLKSTAVLLLLMSVGRIFNGDFGMIYALVGNNTSLFPTTDVIDTFVYRALMDLGDMGMASAVGFFQSVIGFILVITTNAIARKMSPESAIF